MESVAITEDLIQVTSDSCERHVCSKCKAKRYAELLEPIMLPPKPALTRFGKQQFQCKGGCQGKFRRGGARQPTKPSWRDK